MCQNNLREIFIIISEMVVSTPSEITGIQVPCDPKLCILGTYLDGFSVNSECWTLINQEDGCSILERD